MKIFKIFILFFLITPLLFNYSTKLVSGQTKEATPPAVQQIRDKVKEMVREKLQEVRQDSPRAIWGEISQITSTQITINHPRGERKIQISEETKFAGKTRGEIKLEDLKIGDSIIAMGYLNEDNVLQARRLVVIEKPKPPLREVAFGKVTDISTEERSLSVKNDKKAITYTVVANDKTTITKRVDGKIGKVSFDAIVNGDRVVAIGTPSKNEEKFITAKIIHVIPGLSTASPTPKTTPTSD